VREQQTIIDSLNNSFVKLFLKDFSLKSAIEQRSDHLRKYFESIELDKIFEEYSQVHRLKESSQQRASDEEHKKGVDSKLYFSSLDKFQSRNGKDVEHGPHKFNQSAKFINQNSKFFEHNQWKSYKTLLSKGDLLEHREIPNLSRPFKSGVTRKTSEFQPEKDSFRKKTVQEEPELVHDIGISVKKMDKDALIELSINEPQNNLYLGHSKLTEKNGNGTLGNSGQQKESHVQESKFFGIMFNKK
jgi:hypothetical protein